MRIEVLWPRSGGPEIQLHPRITVIVGLLPVERVELISTAHSLAVGDEPAWDGIADVDGAEVSLDEIAGVFGAIADAALILTADEIAEISERHVEAASQSVDVNTDAGLLEPLRARRDDIAEQLTSAETLTSEMCARIASARGNIRPAVFKRLDVADDDLRRVSGLAQRPDPWTGMSDVGSRIDRLGAVIDTIDEKISKLPSGDRVELAGASATARVALSDIDSPLPQAIRILEKISALEAQRKDIEAKFRSLGFDTDGARARLRSAEAAMHTAEQDAMPRRVSPLESTEIERTHDELLAGAQKMASGLRRGAARNRMEGIQEELHSLLEAIGYATWSQYRIGNGEVPVSAESRRTYELSMVELEAAEREWATVTSRMGSDSVLAMVDESLGAVSVEAQRLLGHDPNASTSIGRLRRELADVKVDASSSTLSPVESIAGLGEALVNCGSSVHVGIASHQAVAALGESWLAVLRDADEARLRLVHDRRRCVCELEALRAMGDASRVDRLDQQRQIVCDAEVESRESTDAMCALVEARTELHVLTATRLSLAEEHDQAVDMIESSEQAQHVSERGDRSQVGRLDDMVIRGAMGPLPVLVIASGDADTNLDVITELPDDVQVIVIADTEPTVQWAKSLGDDCAGVVRRQVVD